VNWCFLPPAGATFSTDSLVDASSQRQEVCQAASEGVKVLNFPEM